MRVNRQRRIWLEEDARLFGRLAPPLRFGLSSTRFLRLISGYYNIALDKRTDLFWFIEAGVFAPAVTKIGYLNTQY